MRLQPLLSICLAALALTLGGCTYFHLPILQGNIVTAEQAEKVAVGMTPTQIQQILGTPLVHGSFGADRWDYVLYYRSPKMQTTQRNLSVYFADGKVSKITGRKAFIKSAEKREAKAGSKPDSSITHSANTGLPTTVKPEEE